ncbi:TonB family protein [Sphingomonas sp. JC676]|uniref:TonB family protein n=1 Tax=Sphingomonas sp. JC676 TaxID=2768065 RepID=UPI00165788E6|nr:TonB family protein [Sphingomonas sp. JC676]MBC9032442.1 TonB family protein [Sphingomonas sp. JC676]
MTLALCATMSGAAAAKDREPEVLTRSGKWVVNYDPDACHLLAQFGKNDDPVILRFTRYEPGDKFDLSVLGNKVRSSDYKGSAKINFGLGTFSEGALNGNAGKLKAMFFSSVRLDGWDRKSPNDVPPKVTPAQEASVTGVTLAIRGKRPFRLEFGSLAKPMEQMRACSANLVRSWGYDPAVQQTLLRPASPITAPGEWLASSDYPMAALMQGHNGQVQFRLDVDPKGAVAGCYVLARTSPDDFADVTCRAVSRRAKMQPALDAEGKPVRSFFVTKVHWLAGG